MTGVHDARISMPAVGACPIAGRRQHNGGVALGSWSVGHLAPPPAAYPSGGAAIPPHAPATVDFGPPAPVLAAPTYDPATGAQPYSAQPYASPPVSGGYPYGPPVLTGAIPAQPERRGRVGTIILSVLTAKCQDAAKYL